MFSGLFLRLDILQWEETILLPRISSGDMMTIHLVVKAISYLNDT